MADILAFLVEKMNNLRKRVIAHQAYQTAYINAKLTERLKLEAISQAELTPQMCIKMIEELLVRQVIMCYVDTDKGTSNWAINEEKWTEFQGQFQLTKEDHDLLNRYVALFMKCYLEIRETIQKDQEEKEEKNEITSSATVVSSPEKLD